MMNLNQYEVLTFDCYGTLIDWETGVIKALQPILDAHQIQLNEDGILELFARFESQLEGESIASTKIFSRELCRSLANTLTLHLLLLS